METVLVRTMSYSIESKITQGKGCEGQRANNA
jgi:hypothetical protein